MNVVVGALAVVSDERDLGTGVADFLLEVGFVELERGVADFLDDLMLGPGVIDFRTEAAEGGLRLEARCWDLVDGAGTGNFEVDGELPVCE